MEYKNKKTGAVIVTESQLGGDWEPVAKPKKATEKKTK